MVPFNSGQPPPQNRNPYLLRLESAEDQHKDVSSIQFPTDGPSDANTPNKDAQNRFFEQFSTKQKPPQLMPAEVHAAEEVKSNSRRKTESLPGFDQLPQLDDHHQNRSVLDADGNANSSAPNDYQTFHFSMNQNNFIDPTLLQGYSIRSSEQHKQLLNRLAHKSGLEEQVSYPIGLSSHDEVLQKIRGGVKSSESEINFSETGNYPNHHFGGIVRVETSPQSKRVSQGDNWNLSPISSQVYNDSITDRLRMMSLR